MTLNFDPRTARPSSPANSSTNCRAGIFGKAADHLGAKASIEHSLRHALENLKNLAEEDWFIGRDREGRGVAAAVR